MIFTLKTDSKLRKPNSTRSENTGTVVTAPLLISSTLITGKYSKLVDTEMRIRMIWRHEPLSKPSRSITRSWYIERRKLDETPVRLPPSL